MSETEEILPAQMTGPGIPKPVKAAIVLSLLDQDEAAAIAQQLKPGAVQKALETMQSMGLASQDMVEDALASFVSSLSTSLPLVGGGAGQTALLASKLRKEPVLLPSPDDEKDGDELPAEPSAEEVWAYLSAQPVPKLVKLLEKERGPIVASVLRQLDVSKASAVLGALDPESASLILIHLIGDEPAAPETVDHLAEALGAGRIRSLFGKQGEDGDARSTRLVQGLSPTRQQEILELIKAQIPAKAEAIEKAIVKFSSLPQRLPKTVVAQLLREIDDKTLDQALGLAMAREPEVADFLLSCISQRLAEQIRERIADKPRVAEADGEAAQAELMLLLLSWAEEERFSFKPLPEEDEAA
jgi:flagellar motor switch protein FliG